MVVNHSFIALKEGRVVKYSIPKPFDTNKFRNFVFISLHALYLRFFLPHSVIDALLYFVCLRVGIEREEKSSFFCPDSAVFIKTTSR